MRVLVVENYYSSHLGQLGVALDEHGAELEICKAWEGDTLPASVDPYDGLVVLGGEQSALDDHTHPYIPELADLMLRFGQADRPVLGICLGSQILARAHGGRNLLGEAPEFGWQTIEVTDEGRDDPVLGSVDPQFRIFQWHTDTFTLPENAQRLAGNSATPNQCFRIGRASYGMQFHFEAGRDVVEAWKQEFPEVIRRVMPGWLEDYPRHAENDGPPAEAAGLAIARAWLSLFRR